ncbi:alkyl hydroperoxide reductase/ Thiol specific antioxidant/ Mal allergen [Salinarchaeum sp. Harcht-Bsk1]|uniref:peroxiredoxin n=1 Tax=Salinarchaeum sp. Harcht-Bsk1 TaxID=1333523 RepID=UPI0003423BD7|nr:peroxiredoxin [Salinarchaeum sp. Harcht-Bsk1]AGN01500.1 alkyl hydroperoxide reductase/ Thiol specific antioxidant/ Mal allergen [Salinarchaeum sp. Harcht-Bsk1]
MSLDAGDSAPEIAAENQDGEVVRPSIDGPTVLYFYPRDDTPGCTTEARQFQTELESYRDAGVAVYGVSTDTVSSHREFCDDQGLEFDLLADPDAELADAFDVDTSRGAAARTTFVLLDGDIWRVYEDVSPDGHARDVLGDLLDAGVVELGE